MVRLSEEDITYLLDHLEEVVPDARREFEQLAGLIADIFGLAFAGISVVTADGFCPLGYVGAETADIERDRAVVIDAVQEGGAERGVKVVHQLSDHSKFAEHPYVKGELDLDFCAAAPLVGDGTAPFGGLVVMGREPVDWTEEDSELLRQLAELVVTQLEVHLTSHRLEQANERHQALITASPLGIVTLDRQGRVVGWSKGAERSFEWTEEEVLGERFPLIFDDQLEAFREGIETIFGGEPLLQIDRPYRTKQGERRELSYSAAPLFDPDGTVDKAVVLLEDRTEQRRQQEALETSEERFRQLFEEAGIGMAVVSPEAEMLEVNPAFVEMLGYEAEEVQGRTFMEITHPEDRQKDEEEYRRLKRGEVTSYQLEKRYLRKDGEMIWGRLTASAITDSDGEMLYTLGMIENITARKEAEEELVYRAEHDSLTGLYNRETFERRLASRLKVARRRSESPFALMFMDLDGFKQVNDRFGHSAGDTLLRQIADRLSGVLRSGDEIARMGGDEFAVLLDEVSGREEATHVARRIQRALGVPLRVDEEIVYPSASLGFVLEAEEYSDPDAVLREADGAMYQVKDAGGSSYVIRQQSEDEASREVERLASDIVRGLEEGEFEVRFRPLVDLDDGRLVGLSALPYWEHPDQGLMAPSEFHQAVKNAGKAARLDHWLVEQTCRIAHGWPDSQTDALLGMHVGCTGGHCLHESFLDELVRLRAQQTCAFRSFRIEVSEAILEEGRRRELGRLAELGSSNIEICVSEYGSGSSSLGVLQMTGCGAVKLDAQLVGRLGQESSDEQLAHAIAGAADRFDCELIAAGIEEPTQASWLRQAGYRIGEGSLFSEPLRADEVAELLGAESEAPWAVAQQG